MWLYDLKLLCRRYATEIDWRTVVERARSMRVLTAVAFTCGMLRERLNVAVPDLPELAIARAASCVARRVQQRVARHEGMLALDRLGGLAFTSLLCDRPLAGRALVGPSRRARVEASRAAPIAATSYLPIGQGKSESGQTSVLPLVGYGRT